MHTRKAIKQDVDKIANLYLGLSERDRRFFHPFDFERGKVINTLNIMIQSEKRFRWIKKITPSGAMSLIVAEDNGDIVGFFYIRMRDRKKANLGIVVKEGGKGIGSLLMQAGIADAKDKGVEMFEFTVYPDNEAAIALYKKFGARQVGESDRDVWEGKNQRELVMQIPLLA